MYIRGFSLILNLAGQNGRSLHEYTSAVKRLMLNVLAGLSLLLFSGLLTSRIALHLETNFAIPSRRWQGIRWFQVSIRKGAPAADIVIVSYWLILICTGLAPLARAVRFYSWTRDVGMHGRCKSC
jgi:hypothetical protein